MDAFFSDAIRENLDSDSFFNSGNIIIIITLNVILNAMKCPSDNKSKLINENE